MHFGKSWACVILAGILVAQGVCAVPVKAQEPYPARPVRLVVPFAPGGGSDVVARFVAPGMAERLGQNVVVENRPGAAGIVGTAAVVTANADGYTLLFTPSPPITIAQHLGGRKLPYDPERDLVPVALVAQQPILFVVNAKVPARSLPELIAIGKAKPGKLSYGSAGSGTEMHLTGELLKMAAGVDLVHVPYKGGGPAIADLVAGNIDAMMVVASSILPHVRSGVVRPLATTNPRRLAVLPDVPTTTELGLKDVVMSAWWALFAPAKTPDAAVARWVADLAALEQSAAYRKRLGELGVEPAHLAGAEFARYIQSERAKWKPVVAAAGIKAE